MPRRLASAAAVVSVAACVAIATPALAQVPVAEGTYVVPFQNPKAAAGSTNPLQGIKGGDSPDTYYIVGTSFPNGYVYEGPISKAGTAGTTGTWTKMNVPSSWDADVTSIYGVDNLDGSDVTLVGSWNKGSIVKNGVQSFVYTGPVTSSPKGKHFQKFAAVDPTSGKTADYTFLHSVSGGLVVGNFDFADDLNPAGNAFIYNPTTRKQIPIVFPKREKSFTHTAYGIWWNGGTSYTIAGGASRDRGIDPLPDGSALGAGTLIDYDSSTGKFSNFRAFGFPGSHGGTSIVTHFEGIWSNGKGTYRMPITTLSDKEGRAGFVTIKRSADGTFGPATWTLLSIPGAGELSTGNSLYGKAIVGIYVKGRASVPYAFLGN